MGLGCKFEAEEGFGVMSLNDAGETLTGSNAIQHVLNKHEKVGTD